MLNPGNPPPAACRQDRAGTRAHVRRPPHAVSLSVRRRRCRRLCRVCSDGLTRELDDCRIADVLRAVSDPFTAADALVETAAVAGCHDDVTALVVDAVAIESASA